MRFDHFDGWRGGGVEPNHLYLFIFVVFSNLFVLLTNYIFHCLQTLQHKCLQSRFDRFDGWREREKGWSGTWSYKLNHILSIWKLYLYYSQTMFVLLTIYICTIYKLCLYNFSNYISIIAQCNKCNSTRTKQHTKLIYCGWICILHSV